MREFWVVSLLNGEANGVREFGCSGCDGGFVGGGVKEKEK